MMEIIRKETQSEQVAKILEKQICQGTLNAGEKLPSFREIAEKLNVSFQVVKTAIAILEQHSLVVTKPRVGIFVNPKLLTMGRKDIVLLSAFIHDQRSDYIGNLLSLSKEDIWENCKINRCVVPRNAITHDGLRYELELISKSSPDCLLVSLPQLTPKSMNLFKKLNYPVVFIGDFHDDSIEDVSCQIVEDTAERARSMIDVAASKGRNKIVMMAGQPNVHYVRTLRDSGIEYASQIGVDFKYYPYNDIKSEDMGKFIHNRRNAINSLLKSYTPDAIVTESLARIDLLVEAIEMEGVKIPEDLMIASSHEMHPGITYIKYDYTDFSKKAFELVESVMEDPDKKFGRKTLSGLIKSISLTIDSE